MPVQRNTFCGRIGCGKFVPERMLKYCSQTCALEVQRQQLKALGERRRAGKKELRGGDKACAVCGEMFTPRTVKTVYCANLECKREGMRRKMEAQRARRGKLKHALCPEIRHYPG